MPASRSILCQYHTFSIAELGKSWLYKFDNWTFVTPFWIITLQLVIVFTNTTKCPMIKHLFCWVSIQYIVICNNDISRTISCIAFSFIGHSFDHPSYQASLAFLSSSGWKIPRFIRMTRWVFREESAIFFPFLASDGPSSFLIKKDSTMKSKPCDNCLT